MESPSELEYSEVVPGAFAARWVRCYWSLRAPAGIIGEPQPILPDGCTEIVYDLADPFTRRMPSGAILHQAPAIVVGPTTLPVTVQPTGTVDLFGIRFQPWSGLALSRAPLRELRNLTPEASIAGARLPASLRDELAERSTMTARVEVVERCVMGSLKDVPPPPVSLLAALDHLATTSDPSSLCTLAKSIGTTQRTMQRQFEAMVGLSPKLYARIVRMQRALGIRMREEKRSWSAVAQLAGYYDHAHMVHDFADLAGFAPSVFDEHEHVLTESFVS